ncbi:MAG: indole-3-glycerol phosphate synthase TrpC, partial [Fibrobacterota bacterium]
MFLDKILDQRRKRLLEEKRSLPLDQIIRRLDATARPAPLDFESALHCTGTVSMIGEVKKASPSKGLLRPDFDPVAIAGAYERAGVAAISVLTEQDSFQGAPAYLAQIRKAVRLPLLRKDFILDEYQVYEARLLGADAVLLITAALMDHELRRLLEVAGKLGLHVLMEVHNEKELERTLDAGARIIGINNRDLATFKVDLAVTERLAHRIPVEKTIVSESGIRTREDLARLRDLGVHAALIGEHFMRQADVEGAVRAFAIPPCSGAAGGGAG